ncbi:hypothetical protein HMI55_003271 [Coelomomyces lativittatus]|nr:hypothetical protein HMI55_003271 [Coelomomyces lativittatus]
MGTIRSDFLKKIKARTYGFLVAKGWFLLCIFILNLPLFPILLPSNLYVASFPLKQLLNNELKVEEGSMTSTTTFPTSRSPLRLYTLGLYVLVDEVTPGTESFEYKRVQTWLTYLNERLSKATFFTFYFQVELLEFHGQPTSYIQSNDPNLYLSAQRWFHTSLSSNASMKVLLSKYNTAWRRSMDLNPTENNTLPINTSTPPPMGWTALHSICQPKGSSLLINYTLEDQDTWTKLMMHEMLHSFGCPHDTEEDGEECQGYLMENNMLSVKKWEYSPCSKRRMEELIHLVTCLNPTS